MKPYIIRQGDYLTRLAHERGFDAAEVWGHAKNADLRARRPDMNILAPGDIVWVPQTVAAGLPVTAGGAHRYRAKSPSVAVRVIMREGDRPLADEPYVIEGLGRPIAGRTDGDGLLRFRAPIHAREARVVFHEKNMHYSVRIGHLDPVEEPSGVRQRLEHLGYYGWVWCPRPGDPYVQAGDEERDRRALSLFQRTQGIEATGVLDDASRTALRDVHGG